MQRARGHVVDVGSDHIIGLDLLEHLGVYPHLAVSAILVSAGMNAEQAKLTQPKAQAESSEDRHGKNEHQTFKESGHTHHREAAGEQAAHSIDE